MQRNDLLRHGDPWRSGSTRGGSLDFLPSVREGDITMLNTKAEQFAPFVRRVAVRVFENFRILLRRSIDARSAESVEEFATIEAIMDKQGQPPVDPTEGPLRQRRTGHRPQPASGNARRLLRPQSAARR